MTANAASANWVPCARRFSGLAPPFRGGLEPGDTLLFGSESRGAPEAVHERADPRVRIQQAAGTPSLSLAVAAGIGVAEAIRQTGLWAET